MRRHCFEEPLPDLKATFECGLSRSIADCVEADDLPELLRLLSDRGYGSADLGRRLTFDLDDDDREQKERKRQQKSRSCFGSCRCCCCCGGSGGSGGSGGDGGNKDGSRKNCFCSSSKPANPHKGGDFQTIVHMCLYYQSADIFKHLAECEPQLLLTEDTEGNNLLHCLAKARVLIGTYNRGGSAVGSQANTDPLTRFDEFEVWVMKKLAEVQDPSVSAGSDGDTASSSLSTIYTGSTGDSGRSSCLLTLCRAENEQRLRPLEFAMNVGAFETFKRLAEVDGYLLTQRSRLGANVHATYDLSEYDLATGDRRDRNPLLMLTLLPVSRLDALVASGITKQPLLRLWARRARNDLQPLNIVRTALFAALTLMVSPLTPYFPFIATMVQYGSEMQEGFYRYSDYLNSTLQNQTLNGSDITKKILGDACQSQRIVEFLCDPQHQGAEVVKTSPIFWFQNLQRSTLIKQARNNQLIVGALLAMQLLAIVFNSLERRRFSRQAWLQKHTGESYVQCSFYRHAYHLAFVLGIFHLAFTLNILTFLDCTVWLTRKTRNTMLEVFATIAETAAVLYIFFSMVALMEASEMIGERIAFLNICFRKMCSRFLRVLPLFFIWAYIVFGTVMYMVDFENSEFKSAAYVYYSPLRILLNMATLSSRPSTAILHTLFVLVVSINITNFLIAIVSNEFDVADRHFRLLYSLTKLNYLLVTWRRYGALLKLRHRRPRKLVIEVNALQLD